MASKPMDKWLATYDPIHRGWTRAGIANGLCATSGFFFPRIRGGHNLYRSVASEPESPPELVGAADADQDRVQTFAWVTHQSATEYLFRLVPVSGGGVENWNDAACVPVAFSQTGKWIGSLPNAPTDLQLEPLAYGRFAFRWSYYPQNQHAQPAGFVLYSNDGEYGQVDYGSAESEVPYRSGQVHYEYITRAWPHGTRVGWAVRAFGQSRYEEQNVSAVFALARAEGPPANPVVQVSVV